MGRHLANTQACDIICQQLSELSYYYVVVRRCCGVQTTDWETIIYDLTKFLEQEIQRSMVMIIFRLFGDTVAPPYAM
jgi:hypothetical protein